MNNEILRFGKRGLPNGDRMEDHKQSILFVMKSLKD